MSVLRLSSAWADLGCARHGERAARGRPPLRARHRSLHFANALIVDQVSRALLEFSKLRADASNTTAMSACCGTLMCGIHPLYEGCSISVNADSCRVTVPEVTPNQMVGFGCDIPAERWAVRRGRGDVPMVYSVADELASPPLVALLRALTTPVEPRYLGPGVATFEALCASAPMRLDNAFFAESRAGRPAPNDDKLPPAPMRIDHTGRPTT